MTTTLESGSFLLQGSLKGHYPTFVTGDGVHLVTQEGNRVLDACSGVGVTCLGYSAPSVVARMADQAQRLPFAHGLRFHTPVLAELGKRVAAVTPEGLTQSFFVSGGSEAMETAIKFTRQYWVERREPGRWKFVGRWPSFHGSTLGTLAIGWHKARRANNEALLLPFPHIEAPNTYRGCGWCRRQSEGCTAECADQLERVLVREGEKTVAAFVAEPIIGAAGGALVPPPGYFRRIREICDRYGILLIADEVITGFGRTGEWFGIQHEEVIPDLIVFAKGIGGGFAPLGGITVREGLLDAFRLGSGSFEHNFTMAGHAIACAAGCAVMEELSTRGLVACVRDNAKQLHEAMDVLRESPLVGDVRGRGFLVGIEVVADGDKKTPFPRGLRIAERLAQYALEEGLLVYPGAGGTDGEGDHIMVMPAFVTPPELFPEIASRLGMALERLTREVAPPGAM